MGIRDECVVRFTLRLLDASLEGTKHRAVGRRTGLKFVVKRKKFRTFKESNPDI
jgi:hypothetical protein